METFGAKPLESADKQIERAAEQLLQFEVPEHFIDKGGAGEVFDIGNGWCMKLIINRHIDPNRDRFNLGNSPYQEMRIQERLAHTQFDGMTRVPKLLGVSTKALSNDKFMFIMERLPAVNLQKIIMGEHPLPEDFNVDSYFSDLERFINHMQTRENLAHGDLYARNIMVDTKTTQPYVIDFGRSVDLTPFGQQERARIEAEDWRNLDEVYQAINTLQK